MVFPEAVISSRQSFHILGAIVILLHGNILLKGFILDFILLVCEGGSLKEVMILLGLEVLTYKIVLALRSAYIFLGVLKI